jgi:SAM-dependent methyltransferase
MSSNGNEVQSLVASFNNEAWTYDIRLGNATRAVSEEIIDLVFPSLRSPPIVTQFDKTLTLPERAKVLDIACGTGAFTLSLAMRCEASASSAVESIVATDIAPNMVKILSTALKDRGFLDATSAANNSQPENKTKEKHTGSSISPRISAAVCNGQDHSELFPSGGIFDLIVTNFGIFFYPDPYRGAAEMYRLLSDKKGAVAVTTCWQEMGNWPIFTEVQRRIKPRRLMQVIPSPAWQDGTLMERVLKDAGFASVKMEQRKVVQWMYGIPALSKSLAELLRGQSANVWTVEERNPEFLVGVIEEILRESKDRYLIELDKSGGKDAKNARIGFELTAWIASASKTAL